MSDGHRSGRSTSRVSCKIIIIIIIIILAHQHKAAERKLGYKHTKLWFQRQFTL